MEKISVTNLKIVDLSPKIKNPNLLKYVPKTLIPHYVEFAAHNVNNAISNAIRRTMACELLVSGLHVEYENIDTNDVFIRPEMIISRLRMIPISQNTPLDAEFILTFTNNTERVIDVKSSEIRIVNSGENRDPYQTLKKLPFNETFTLFTLDAGKSIKITNITVNQMYGFIEGYGTHVLAVNCASISVDQKPYNAYEPESDQLPSSLANPKVWLIKFTTNGSLEPKKIVVNTCNNLIERIRNVHELLYSIQKNDNEYALVIDGETDTIGNLFMRTINDMFPDIPAIVYSTKSVGRILTLRMRCNDDVSGIYDAAIKHLIKVFSDIKKFFE